MTKGRVGFSRVRRSCIVLFVLTSPLLFVMVVRGRYLQQGNRFTYCKSNLVKLATGLEVYADDHEGHMPGSLEALVPKYLEKIPECAEADTLTYRAVFGLDAPRNTQKSKDYYYLECQGENHSTFTPGNYPAYNDIEGLVDRAPQD